MPTPPDARVQALAIYGLTALVEYADAAPVRYTTLEILAAVQEMLRSLLVAASTRRQA